jgi:calcineurin-like phosphoesterase family protein
MADDLPMSRAELRRSRLIVAATTAVGMLFVACNGGPSATPTPTPPGTTTPSTTPTTPVSTTSPGAAVVIAAAGDIACDPGRSAFNGGNGTADECRMKATSDLLIGMKLDAVLTLGDNQYEDGARSKWARSYGPTWGRLKSITHPAPGNHDYKSAAGYYSYFGAAAADPTKGWYSYDLGAWHLIALNSNCGAVGGCDRGSPQEKWLREDLAAHPNQCTLASWHHPRFSSSRHHSSATYTAFWQALYEFHAELVLQAHDHTYERFGPQTASGGRDEVRGIRSFVVGTGGRSHYSFTKTEPNSEVRNATAFGVIKLTLRDGSYDWSFVPAAPATFTDTGSGTCH